MAAFTLNLSDERRAVAIAWIRRTGLLDLEVSYAARVMSAVGALICDDSGRAREADLEAALQDPSVIQIARQLLREARL